jgi:hypothetical protein
MATDEAREVGRLSTYLRAYGHVSHPDDKHVDIEDDLIEAKRDAEIFKRRVLAKRKAEEEGKNVKPKTLFGANIPFRVELREPKTTDDLFKNLAKPQRDKFLLRNQITFDYEINAFAVEQSKSTAKRSIFTVDWLEKQISDSFGSENPTGLSAAEFSMTLVGLLNTKRTSDDLQTELFDLLGFER